DTWNFNRDFEPNIDIGFELGSHKPTLGSVHLGRGADLNGDGLGDGGNYFLDPTPEDHSEFTVPVNAFSATAAASSPAAGKFDFYTFVLHEIGHAVGVSSYFPLDWPDDFLGEDNFTEDTDRLDAFNGIGTYWWWHSPTVDALMTDNDGGPPPA